jgi:type VII secretion effector (TIGR04197 family)
MSRQIYIDYNAVASTVSDITGKIDSSSLTSDYATMESALSDSKGDAAKAIKGLLKAEKALIKQLSTTMRQMAMNIQSAAEEFKTEDHTMSG